MIFAGAAISVGGILVLQSIFPYLFNRNYELTPAMYSLVGESRDDAGEYLSLNKETGSHQFIVPEAAPSGEGASEHTGRVTDAYSATFPAKAKDGVSVTDSSTKISVTLAPDFYTTEGQRVDGDHMVYLNGHNKLVYTLKYNGLKEDIIVPEYRKDELTFGFKLRLPAGAEARLNSSGNIGIYISDPNLYGDISFGSDDDRERVEKARKNGPKNYNVMTIPAPVVKDMTGEEFTDRASFELSEAKAIEVNQKNPDMPAEALSAMIDLNEYKLTIRAKNLKDLTYPISVDPTMLVSSANNFEGVANESGMDLDFSKGEIRRSSLSGGRLDSWSNNASENLPTSMESAAAYANGYIYITSSSSVYFAKVDTSDSAANLIPDNPACAGTSAWCQTSTLIQGGTRNELIYLKGYLFAIGCGNCANSGNMMQKAKINSDGTLGAWSLANNMGGASEPVHAVAHKGRIYAFRSNTAIAWIADVNADGTLAWTQTGAQNPPAGNYAAGDVVIYGDTIYLMTDNTVVVSNKIRSDGTMSPSWRTESSLNNAHFTGMSVAHKGYIYRMGGCNTGTCNGVENTVSEYAQINADGSLGAWKTTTSLPAKNSRAGIVAIGRHLLIIGGCFNFNSGCTAPIYTIQKAQIRPAGETNAWTTEANTLNNRGDHIQVTHNGYIYVLTGRTDTNTMTNTIRYAQINADGTLGTWNTNPSNTPYRFYAAGFAHNGYMYISGGSGHSTSNASLANVQNLVYYAQINSDGTVSGTWTPATNLPTARRNHMLTVYNNRVYLTGGFNGSGVYFDTVHYATINSNGSLGSWDPAGNNFTGVRSGHGAVAFNDYLYVFGGWDGNTNYSDVQYASINSDGTLNAWAPTTSLPGGGRRNASVVVYKGHVYIVGGALDSSVTNTVIFGKFQSNGTIANWHTAVETIPVARSAMGNEATAFNDHLYVSGGADGGTYFNNSFRASVNNGGNGLATQEFITSNEFTPWGTGFGGNSRYGQASAQYTGVNGTYLYISGGVYIQGCILGTCTRKVQNDIRQLTVGSDGHPAGASGYTLPGKRAMHTLVQVNGYLFLIGGVEANGADNDLGGTMDTVWRSQINPADGTLGAWTELTTLPTGLLPIATRSHAASVYGNKIIITGGYNGSYLDKAYYASVDENGNLSSWQETASMPQARVSHTSHVVGDTLLVLGGHNNAAVYASILAADIASDGSLSNWRTIGNLPSPRQSHTSAVANGFIYFRQGCNSSSLNISACSNNSVHDTWVAPVGIDGQLGHWAGTVTNTTASTVDSRVNASMEIIEGRLHDFGGCRSGCNDPGESAGSGRFIGLASIPRNGSFSKTYDFGSGVRPTQLITRGNKIEGGRIRLTYYSTNDGGSTLDNIQAIDNAGLGAANMLNINLGTGRTLSRYLFVRYTIDDQLGAVFPDGDNETSISEFDMYYISNPGKRLRGGRTFTNGLDRGLDARPQ